MKRVFITKAQRDFISIAARSPIGTVSVWSMNGLGRASKTKMANTLCSMGLLQPYPHGNEYEITEAGRLALSEARDDK